MGYFLGILVLGPIVWYICSLENKNKRKDH